MKGPIERLARRVDNMVARCVLWMADNSKRVQEVQVSLQNDEVRIAQRVQEYGYSSVPLAECEAVIVFPGGIRDHALVIATDDGRYRPTNWAAGEVGLYTHEGDYIRMRAGRIVEVVCGAKLEVTAPDVVVHASTKVRVETPLCEMTGNLTVSGTVQGNAVRTAAGIQLGTHVHSGVQSGPSNTGAPVP
jgi:phage baseplate assembly protein V